MVLSELVLWGLGSEEGLLFELKVYFYTDTISAGEI